MAEFKSFEELERFLRDFEMWDSRGGFDFGGIVALLGACLECISEKALPQELKDIDEHLTPKQRDALMRIVASVGDASK